VDIRMPPTHTDEGLVAAQRIRTQHPEIGVLVLSQYVEPSYAMRLIQDHPERVGYLLKEGSSTPPSSWTRFAGSPKANV
jgi:DNA-binding NarL/FixJ family response regulator